MITAVTVSCQTQNDDAAEVCESANLSMAKELELEAVKCAEGGNLQRALELLTEAQKVSSEYASAYNNRAQVSGDERKECEIWHAEVLLFKKWFIS